MTGELHVATELAREGSRSIMTEEFWSHEASARTTACITGLAHAVACTTAPLVRSDRPVQQTTVHCVVHCLIYC